MEVRGRRIGTGNPQHRALPDRFPNTRKACLCGSEPGRRTSPVLGRASTPKRADRKQRNGTHCLPFERGLQRHRKRKSLTGGHAGGCTLSHNADGVASACADESVRPLSHFTYATRCKNHAARLHSQGPALSGLARWRCGGDGLVLAIRNTELSPTVFQTRARPVCVGRSQADARVPCWAGRRLPSVQTENSETEPTDSRIPTETNLAGRPSEYSQNKMQELISI